MEEKGIPGGCEGLPTNGFPSIVAGQEQAEGVGKPVFVSAHQYSLQ